MELSKKDYDLLDKELMQFKDIDKSIATRQMELMSKDGINFITHRTNGLLNHPDTIIETWSDDLILRNMDIFKETVQKLIAEMDKEQKEIFSLHWLTHQYTWQEVMVYINCSKSSIYRKRKIILKKYAKLKGWH
ncbi:transcriptional regulator [Streptococcus equi subsp. zooepidemicus]|uniref:transcriptional regulator n=1 Tax=Streptococcus equi TaxID=1336 RepID=UPI001BAE5AB6|nr:transcriptional regulator [Streptococcus equi]MCD3433178.1 transcriptional regulator [Streptococcus equi subsp. zooepidemicus]QUF62140.1 transcriptional regulator [Streptococcus equi subsp. zooepidemicus]WOK56822.1 transcriptional regulator [Streptococcus equi subsp. zooepidemicus]HEL0000872.1 transcriptional regulator [Streptococcus equi subsp. zooepidemicus]HEL0067060.1 transcriptional regulator [Streptococcus equi subsp. zooepidemicus]